MISICIPVYNYNISELTVELIRQGNDSGADYEIILIDDCSLMEYRKANKALFRICKYIQLDRNVGRARIRNLFMEHARYENLLFVDCDSVIIREDFLLRYIKDISENGSLVICGGRVYETVSPPGEKKLRWKYGTFRESQPPSVRRKSPFRFFMSNNLLLNKKVLDSIRFDERLLEYGYEDTLFGYWLMKNKIKISHIENPVLHGHIETNSEFLEKTEKSVANLMRIVDFVGCDDDFVNNIRLLQIYIMINRIRLTGICRFSLNQLSRLFKYFLSRGFVYMWMFDLYKLDLLMQAGKLPLVPANERADKIKHTIEKSNSDH
ncbi:MAG: glycosyltransferase family 2 protein [Bacteroidales bacterium]